MLRGAVLAASRLLDLLGSAATRSGPSSTRQVVWCELFVENRLSVSDSMPSATIYTSRGGVVDTTWAQATTVRLSTWAPSWRAEPSSPASGGARLSTASELDIPALAVVGPELSRPPPACDIFTTSTASRADLRCTVASCAPGVDIRGAYFAVSHVEVRRVHYGDREMGGRGRGDTFRVLRAVGQAAADPRLAQFNAGCSSFDLLSCPTVGDARASARAAVMRERDRSVIPRLAGADFDDFMNVLVACGMNAVERLDVLRVCSRQACVAMRLPCAHVLLRNAGYFCDSSSWQRFL